MCSVVEIASNSEYYIHYHSPESLDTIWSDGGDVEDLSGTQDSLGQDYHQMFVRQSSRDLDTDLLIT